MSRAVWAASLALATGILSGCASGDDLDPLAGGTDVVSNVSPGTVLDGTSLRVETSAGVAGEAALVQVDGRLDGQPFHRQWTATPTADGSRWRTEPVSLPVGVFAGTVAVATLDPDTGMQRRTAPASLNLVSRPALTPTLSAIDMPETAYVADRVRLSATDILLAGEEGETTAVVRACREGEGACREDEVALLPPADRDDAELSLLPEAFGLAPGRVTGELHLRSVHRDGTVTTSEALSYDVRLVAPDLSSSLGALSVGRLTALGGGGFASGDAATLIDLDGQLLVTGRSTSIPLAEVHLVADAIDARTARVTLHDDDALALRVAEHEVDIRSVRGVIDGRARVRVESGAESVASPWVDVQWRIEPVRQVVHLVFADSFGGALHHYGVGAAAPEIQHRIVEVMARDYAGVGVELRLEPPEDYAQYTTLVIGGPDPSGRDAFGQDNTPDKDRGNRRLYDHVGGYSDASGFGGVFAESFMVHYSAHPPSGLEPSRPTTPSADFDRIFDPVRPDLGTPLTIGELAPGSLRGFATTACPGGDRSSQVRCAAGILANMVGSTASHELGHALGLANPDATPVHYATDVPRRLMDVGGARPFRERAELGDEGPAVFCGAAFEYLQRILPPAEPDAADSVIRPPC
ncbi:MAG: hypothetical protein AAF721_18695 [Myxococcota bacterium]